MRDKSCLSKALDFTQLSHAGNLVSESVLSLCPKQRCTGSMAAKRMRISNVTAVLH